MFYPMNTCPIAGPGLAEPAPRSNLTVLERVSAIELKNTAARKLNYEMHLMEDFF
jgi:hypothetical protein